MQMMCLLGAQHLVPVCTHLLLNWLTELTKVSCR